MVNTALTLSLFFGNNLKLLLLFRVYHQYLTIVKWIFEQIANKQYDKIGADDLEYPHLLSMIRRNGRCIKRNGYGN
ncbi:hypothetical protein D3C75_1150580 [compost metagenome]